jgi:hypothetical protein
MIELTREQWQAIAAAEHPIAVEPQSKTAYVVVREDEYAKLRAGEAEAARLLRILWMQRMGLDEDEIAESLRDDPPVRLDAEMEQLKALDNLDKITPAGDVLRQFAIKY